MLAVDGGQKTSLEYARENRQELCLNYLQEELGEWDGGREGKGSRSVPHSELLCKFLKDLVLCHTMCCKESTHISSALMHARLLRARASGCCRS